MSAYLDDLDPPVGSTVYCRANLSAPHFTVGRAYEALPDFYLIDDTGQRVIPSARFSMERPNA